MTVTPSEVNVAGSGNNEVFTITKEITGGGGAYSTPMDVVFALDSSGSMGGTYASDPDPVEPKRRYPPWNPPYPGRISASLAFLNSMTLPPDQAGVVSWDDGIDFTLPLTSDPVAVSDALLAVDSSGGTNLDEGLQAAWQLLQGSHPNPDRKCAIIFLTDGVGTYSGVPSDNVCPVYAIGYGSSAAMGPLEDMANTTGGKFYPNPTYPVVDPSTIDLIFQDIYEEISTVPYNVTVQETVQDYIEIIPGSCTPVPDYGPVNGRVIWEDIGMLADGDPAFPADETVTLTCEARSTKGGKNIPVNIPADSYMTYEDKDGNTGEVGIPQAFITSNTPPNIDNAHASTDCFRTRLPGYTDHRLEEVTIEGVTDPDGDEVEIEITGITSDEPITSGGCQDARISADANAAMLRIERYGRNGRVYEISFTASDGKAVSEGSVQVVIPYDDRARSPRYLPPRYSCEEVIDDGQSYDATAEGSCLPKIKPPYFPIDY